ncbi:MAG: hypothetical protein EP343_08275 [Deltaproteobacteria bacterium]|nr:MAG: hypothetical protein EP343_08275 [Deltaproteobacteria bacterium]
MVDQNKTAETSRKETTCSSCEAKFWYIDPRPGGRPRKKCGVCSSRPPRYPWGFITPPAGGWENEPALSKMYEGMSVEMEHQPSSKKEARPKVDTVASDMVPMPSADFSHLSSGETQAPKRHIARSESTMDQSRIEQQLDDISRRLAELEMKVNSMRSQFVGRADWVDTSARLDMVEHSMSETLGKVRGRLDSFSKEVRQIAVVPERELGEMFDLIRMIRRYLDNS